MEEAVLVTGIDPLEAVVDHQLDLLFRDVLVIPLDDLVEVPFHELEDEVQALILVSNHFFELDDVVVVESAEYFDFSQVHRFLPGCTL